MLMISEPFLPISQAIFMLHSCLRGCEQHRQSTVKIIEAPHLVPELSILLALDCFSDSKITARL